MHPRLETLHHRLTGDGWTFPLLAGVVADAFALVEYWQTSSGMLSLWPVIVAGFVAGLLFSGRPRASRRIGFRTGLVGGLAIVVPLVDVLAAIPGFAQPAWFSAVQVVVMVAFGVLAVVFSGGFGAVGAMFGDWLAGRIRRRRGTAASN